MKKTTTLLILLLISFIDVFSQKAKNPIYGNWRIANIVFLFTSDYEEKIQARKGCLNCKLDVNDSLFLFKSTKKCAILQKKSNFVIYDVNTLYLTNASQYYSKKAIDYIFDEGKRQSVEVYGTNYQIENDDDSNLKIIKIDNDNMILYYSEALIFLKRE